MDRCDAREAASSPGVNCTLNTPAIVVENAKAAEVIIAALSAAHFTAVRIFKILKSLIICRVILSQIQSVCHAFGHDELAEAIAGRFEQRLRVAGVAAEESGLRSGARDDGRRRVEVLR